MKVIVAGSRTVTDSFFVRKTIESSGFTLDEIVSGGEPRGADKQGELYAQRNKIPVKRFDADWERFGKAAGPKRNREMALYADALIAIWENESKGTLDMLNQMYRQRKPFHLAIVQNGRPVFSTQELIWLQRSDESKAAIRDGLRTEAGRMNQ